MESLEQREWDKKRLEDIPQRIGEKVYHACVYEQLCTSMFLVVCLHRLSNRIPCLLATITPSNISTRLLILRVLLYHFVLMIKWGARTPSSLSTNVTVFTVNSSS